MQNKIRTICKLREKTNIDLQKPDLVNSIYRTHIYTRFLICTRFLIYTRFPSIPDLLILPIFTRFVSLIYTRFLSFTSIPDFYRICTRFTHSLHLHPIRFSHLYSIYRSHHFTWPRGYKTFFMLNSAKHGISNARKHKNIKKFNICQAQVCLEW